MFSLSVAKISSETCFSSKGTQSYVSLKPISSSLQTISTFHLRGSCTHCGKFEFYAVKSYAGNLRLIFDPLENNPKFLCEPFKKYRSKRILWYLTWLNAIVGLKLDSSNISIPIRYKKLVYLRNWVRYGRQLFYDTLCSYFLVCGRAERHKQFQML